jgi:hypothetical protein
MNTRLTILALVAAVLLPASAAEARTNVRVGIGDQQASMFDQPAFTKLKIKRVRYFIRWDAIRHPDVMAAAENYVRTARAHHATVLMHISSDNLVRKKAKLPSLKRYTRDVTKLVKHFKHSPYRIKEWGARNEANHDSQATWKSPKRAAQEFKIVRKACGRSCRIVALDVLDQAGVERYIKRYFRALGKYKRYATTIGIHNYSDVNRKRTTGTRSIIRTVKRYNKRANFWLTETGGVVNFGRSFKYSPSRAAKRLGYLFKIVRRMRHDIQRVYVYNWTGAERHARFDAGIVGPTGKPRPGYKVLRKNLKKFKR